MTNAEKKLWHQCLRRFPLQWYRQKPLDHFIADFYCPKLRLVIEVDGEIHSTAEARAYDEGRTKILEGYGIKVLRFKNSEVFKNFEEVCRAIEAELQTQMRGTNRSGSI
jgi:very-short-patch-repair endonuclease